MPPKATAAATKLKPKTTTTRSTKAKKDLPPPAEIILLFASELVPHPLNPRPWSDLYDCHVHDEKVEELIYGIGQYGYDYLEPVQVRKIGDGYQIIVGHHRFCALRVLGMKVPCVVLELDDIEVAIRLVQRQGRSIDPWDLCNHAYQLTQVEQMCSQVDYGAKTGYSTSLVSKWIRAQMVLLATKCKELSVTAAATIARAAEEHWKELSDQAIARKLSTRDIERLVSNLQGKTEDPAFERIDMPTVETPTKNVKLEQHLVTETQVPTKVLSGAHPPVGYLSNLRRWETGHAYDLILIDRTVLREDVQSAIAQAMKYLNKSGRLIFVCEPRHSLELLTVARAEGLELQQKLIWLRGDITKDDLDADLWPRAYREILVFNALDLVGWFDGSAAAKHFGMTPSDVFKLAPTLNGGLPGTLAELLFRTYAPSNSQILIPAAYESAAIVAGCKLNHHVTWLEASQPLFDAITQLLTQ